MAGALFFVTIATFMPPFMTTNVTFAIERPVFLREQANQMYGVPAYYFAKMISELPGFLVVPLLVNLITYWALGLNSIALQFFQFWLIYTMNSLAAISFGYLVSCSFKDADIAMSVAPNIAMPMLLVAGFGINAGT